MTSCNGLQEAVVATGEPFSWRHHYSVVRSGHIPSMPRELRWGVVEITAWLFTLRDSLKTALRLLCASRVTETLIGAEMLSHDFYWSIKILKPNHISEITNVGEILQKYWLHILGDCISPNYFFLYIFMYDMAVGPDRYMNKFQKSLSVIWGIKARL